jgi:hypothetical protein
MIRNTAAAVIGYLHLAIVFFLLLGWLATNDLVLLIHFASVPLIMLQWKFNDGTCLLTNLEEWLSPTPKKKDQQQGQLIKSILLKCMDELPTDSTIKKGLYSILWISFSISGFKLFLS